MFSLCASSFLMLTQPARFPRNIYYAFSSWFSNPYYKPILCLFLFIQQRMQIAWKSFRPNKPSSTLDGGFY
jgi:hypothetical protein